MKTSIGHLPGVLLFEGDGALVAKRPVPALGIVDVIDEARQCSRDVDAGLRGGKAWNWEP